MNSLDKIFKPLAMAILILITLTGYATGTDPVSYSRSVPDPNPSVTGQAVQHDSSTEKNALSGNSQLFNDTRIGKRLNQYRQRLIRNLRFEYSRTIGDSSSTSDNSAPLADNGEKQTLKTISFSGELDKNMVPVFEFKSRLNVLDFSSMLHLVDHEVKCDISSRPVNNFIGGKAAIRFHSDGNKHDAFIRVKFDL